MPMDGRLVELVDVRGLGPAHVWVLEVGAGQDGAFRDLEVAVNEVNADCGKEGWGGPVCWS